MVNLTNRLLKKAERIANEAHKMGSILTDVFNERYGITYSDVDADSIIDALDYGVAGGLTVEDCDRIMTDAGYPPLTKGE